MDAQPRRRRADRLNGLVYSRIVWIALSVAIVIGTLSAFWDPSNIDERAYVPRLTHQSVEAIRADIAADMRSRFLAQIRLAEVLIEELREKDHQSLDVSARLFVEHHPSDLGLEWIDPAARIRWSLARDSRHQHEASSLSAPQLRSVIDAARTVGNGEVLMSRTFSLADHSFVTAVVIPLFSRGTFVGSLVSLFDVTQTLDEMLMDHRELGFAVSVREGTTEIYRTPGGNSEHEGTWGQDTELQVAGVTWRLRAWPTSETLATLRSSLPELVVLSMALLGFMLTVSVHFARTARLRSEELREARDGLELRVRERTMDLERANADLVAEINQRKRAEDSLQHLSGRLLQLQDEERRRIARELHDSTTQLLGALSIDLDQARQLANAASGEKLSHLLRESARLLEQITLEIRTVSYLLHPPMLDELGLQYVLPWYAGGFSKRSGIRVDLALQPDLGRMPREVELTLFRLTQEALSNVHRHSGSRSVRIALSRTPDTVTLAITDQGKGMASRVLTPVAGHIADLGVGILGMRERVRQLGGQLEILGKGQGTTILARLPLTPLAAP